MKKFLLTTAAVSLLAISFGGVPVWAQGQNLPPYTPLEPIPGFTSGFDVTNPGNLPHLINNVFTIAITIGALLAVLMLTVGGIEYMIAESVGRKSAGLRRARSALFGILLVAGAWLILHTINPQLLNFTYLNPCTGSNCATSAPSTSMGSGTTGTTGSGGSSSNPITVNASVQTYSAQSSYGQSVNTALNGTGTLTNTQQGIAVVSAPSNNLSDSDVINRVNTFTGDCQNVGGSVVKTSGGTQTLYTCVKSN